MPFDCFLGIGFLFEDFLIWKSREIPTEILIFCIDAALVSVLLEVQLAAEEADFLLL
jgi:hypothetical protein